MSLPRRLIDELTPLSRVFCSPDYDRAVERLREELPFDVHRYSAADEPLNGWLIPPRWAVETATIHRESTGELVYDGRHHPLGVIALSTGFRGTVMGRDLRDHLHYDHRFPDALPFHFRQQYRSWDRDWGFCVPRTLYDAIEADEWYRVELVTQEGPGYLDVLEHTHPGTAPECFAFVAHLDHPGMANDDLAGCAVGVEVFRLLAERKTKFTYKLLLVQEIMGSEYWWGRTNRGNAAGVLEAMFLEMLGTTTPFSLQASLDGRSALEATATRVLTQRGTEFRTGEFTTIIVNDEYVWEARGVPMSSLSRFPYPEYHTDLDSADLIDDGALEESVGVVLNVIDELDRSRMVRKRFAGTVCLSNPEYELYVDPGQPALGTTASDHDRRLRAVMEIVPTLRGPTTVEQIAQRVGLQPDDVFAYLQRWASKGLLEIV